MAFMYRAGIFISGCGNLLDSVFDCELNVFARLISLVAKLLTVMSKMREKAIPLGDHSRRAFAWKHWKQLRAFHLSVFPLQTQAEDDTSYCSCLQK